MSARAAEVLLVVHARTRLPRTERSLRDFDVLQDVLDADVLDLDDLRTSTVASLLARALGRSAGLGWLAATRSSSYQVVYCDSEGYGLALALLVRLARRRSRLTVMVHNLGSPLKRLLLKVAQDGVTSFLVNGTALQQRLVQHHGVAPDKVHFVPMFVDTDYWRPSDRPPADDVYICSAGRELRDYDGLCVAAADLPVQVRIAAASSYARSGPPSTARILPANVRYIDCDTSGLRALYDGAVLVVVPLHEGDSVAGATTIAEAMAMGKCVVASRSTGQGDTVQDRRSVLRLRTPSTSRSRLTRSPSRPQEDGAPTGFHVPPGDARELQSAIRYLLGHPEQREALGASGRRVAERVLDVRLVGAHMAEVIRPGGQAGGATR